MDNFNIYMLGKLDSNVFVNAREIIQFIVKTVSKKPNYTLESDRFTCFAEDLYEYGFVDDENDDKELRAERFHDFLSEKLLIFKPTQSSGNPVTSDEIFVKKPEVFSEDFTCRAIPVFSKKKLKMSFEEFKRKLLDKEWIESIYGLSENINEAPSLIFFEDEEKIRAITGIKRQFYQYGKVRYDFNELNFIDENEKWYENFVRSPKLEEIIFVEENTCLEIENLGRIISSNTQDFEESNYEEIKNVTSNSEEALDFTEERKGNIEVLDFTKTTGKNLIDVADYIDFSDDFVTEEDYRVKNEALTRTKSIERTLYEEKVDEKTFINNFIETCKAMNLLYKQEDLINFHTAMKSSKLVILSGMSGTGKSKIVQAYGKALGLDKERLNFISVRPSWADDSDLLGYLDTMNNVYRPGDSGFIDTLVEASNNKDKLYIVCLDEMNLARVEHYFSQILSVLELDGEDRVLKLYNREFENILKNSDKYKPDIQIGDNILFVGTVNLDESTYHFSDKVLDRANVITLNQVNFLELKNLGKIKLELVPSFEVSFLDYNKMINSSENINLTDRELELLSEIHESINFLNRNVGIGFRIISQIDGYIRNIPEDSIITRKEGIDIQLAQRILPKIRGTKEQWGDFIGEYDIYGDGTFDSNNLNSGLIEILNKYSDVSDFETSKKYVLNKARELSIYGYTL